MSGEGDLETEWGGKEGRSCLVLGGSKLRVWSKLGQGLETLFWEKGRITGEGAGDVTWGGRSTLRRDARCCADTRGGRGPGPSRAGAWALGHWGERLGAVWGEGCAVPHSS